MKKNLLTACLLMIATAVFAQKTDTVVVELAKTSRVVFTIKDKSDLEQLKQYDFQALFDDILKKLEQNESVVVVIDSVKEVPAVPEATEAWATTDNSDTFEDDDYSNNENDDDHYFRKRVRHRGTTHSFDLDLGINSMLENGKFPDEEGKPYAVRPWGSWYVGLNSVQRTGLGKNFYLQWSLGVSWYNFKFQNDKIQVIKDDEGLSFEEDFRDASFIKSKLGVTYVNAAVVPMYTVGGRKHSRRWRSYNTGFRIGVGPYAGYRIGSHTKQVYEVDGDRHRNRERDNFYLSNLRYGVRVQVGVGSADFFFNYDMNELFAAGKGPELNAFSFGITF